MNCIKFFIFSVSENGVSKSTNEQDKSEEVELGNDTQNESESAFKLTSLTDMSNLVSYFDNFNLKLQWLSILLLKTISTR